MQDLQTLLQRNRMPGHLQDHVDAKTAVCFSNRRHGPIGWGKDGGGAHPFGELPPEGIRLDAINGGSSLRPGDAHGA